MQKKIGNNTIISVIIFEKCEIISRDCIKITTVTNDYLSTLRYILQTIFYRCNFHYIKHLITGIILFELVENINSELLFN